MLILFEMNNSIDIIDWLWLYVMLNIFFGLLVLNIFLILDNFVLCISILKGSINFYVFVVCMWIWKLIVYFFLFNMFNVIFSMCIYF